MTISQQSGREEGSFSRAVKIERERERERERGRER
jgi:hypothetical protein